MKKSKLVFIISQPRSGSTLLSTILSNSPEVSANSEENWILLPFLSFDRPDLNDSVFGTELTSEAISNSFSKATILKELTSFLSNLYQTEHKSASKYILDKTPRYYEILDEITRCFPDSKIIILKRNPLDVLASIFSRWPRKHFFDLIYFGRDIIDAPIIIDQFLKSNLNNPNVYAIGYEDIVNDTGQAIKQLFQWLNIPFEMKFMKYNRNEVPKFGDHKIAEHNHAHRQSLNSWKRLLVNKKYRSFIQGYIDYLIKNNYTDYALEKCDHQSTFVFRTFFDFKEFVADSSKCFSGKNLFKYFKFYILSKTL
jgi:hypothetical protein